jgi:peptidoglycan/LPS O-acetylase OafA/YrhL
LGNFVWNFAQYKFKRMSAVLIWISKYEYGIYLWHLVIMNNLYENSPWFQYWADKSYILFTGLLILISCLVGYISTLTVDEGIVKKLKL